MRLVCSAGRRGLLGGRGVLMSRWIYVDIDVDVDVMMVTALLVLPKVEVGLGHFDQVINQVWIGTVLNLASVLASASAFVSTSTGSIQRKIYECHERIFPLPFSTPEMLQSPRASKCVSLFERKKLEKPKRRAVAGYLYLEILSMKERQETILRNPSSWRIGPEQVPGLRALCGASPCGANGVPHAGPRP